MKIKKVFGQAINDVILYFHFGDHSIPMFIHGSPGSGKTSLMRVLSKVLDEGKSKILDFTDTTKEERRRALKENAIILLDGAKEITLELLNEILREAYGKPIYINGSIPRREVLGAPYYQTILLLQNHSKEGATWLAKNLPSKDPVDELKEMFEFLDILLSLVTAEKRK